MQATGNRVGMLARARASSASCSKPRKRRTTESSWDSKVSCAECLLWIRHDNLCGAGHSDIALTHLIKLQGHYATGPGPDCLVITICTQGRPASKPQSSAAVFDAAMPLSTPPVLDLRSP